MEINIFIHIKNYIHWYFFDKIKYIINLRKIIFVFIF